jgi:ferredoxin
MCAVVLPERITLDEWGYPVIEPGPIGTTPGSGIRPRARWSPDVAQALRLDPIRVPDHLLSQARRAVDVCPVLALRLRQVDSAPAGTSAAAGRGTLRAGA